MSEGKLSIPIGQISDRYFARNLIGSVRKMLEDRSTIFYFSILVVIISIGVFGPLVAPYGPSERMYGPEGSLLITQPPSIAHPLGTNDQAYDVFSRILHGARPTVLAGVIGGSLIISIGTAVGITAGYIGGRVENVLMRVTDIVYGVPLIPFAIVLIGLFGIGFFKSILVIGLVLWRGSARVIRSQTLQIKERPYIIAAKATGVGTPTIILKHILPNIAPMTVLFFALGIGYTIIIQAGLAFLGVVTPFVPSWGVMVRNAYSSGLMVTAWWWSIPPSLMIALTVTATFMFGRGYERVVGSVSEDSITKVG